MSTSHDSTLPPGVYMTRLQSGNLVPSKPLMNLLVAAREDYRDWPKRGMKPAESQQAIIDLETEVAHLLGALNESSAHMIVTKVSNWGRNRKKALVEGASPQDRTHMLAAIRLIMDPAKLRSGLDELSELPGLALVMATKVYRFCCANKGGAVDKHASNFFNSLDILDSNGVPCKSTHFKLGWKGRLETYSLDRKDHLTNLNQFFEVYLPLLTQLADFLNERRVTYRCAATKMPKSWCPADVEMATYYWGAQKARSGKISATTQTSC